MRDFSRAIGGGWRRKRGPLHVGEGLRSPRRGPLRVGGGPRPARRGLLQVGEGVRPPERASLHAIGTARNAKGGVLNARGRGGGAGRAFEWAMTGGSFRCSRQAGRPPAAQPGRAVLRGAQLRVLGRAAWANCVWAAPQGWLRCGYSSRGVGFLAKKKRVAMRGGMVMMPRSQSSERQGRRKRRSFQKRK